MLLQQNNGFVVDFIPATAKKLNMSFLCDVSCCFGVINDDGDDGGDDDDDDDDDDDNTFM